MADRGRKRIPTKLKKLRGNPGVRPLPEKELEPSKPSTLEPPDWLRPDAKRFWFALAPEFHALGILTVPDVPALAAFCSAYADFRRADVHLESEGDMEIVTTKSGEMKKENPWYYVKARALIQCDKYAAQFGIGASYRAKLATVGNDDEDEFTKWKKGSGKK